MLITTSLSGVKLTEESRFERADPGKKARLIALLFCRPDHELMTKEIIPSLPYFHFRSGHNTAFYFGGFERDGDEWTCNLQESRGPTMNESMFQAVRAPDGSEWYFIPHHFNSFRREVEASIKWRYSGGCDMILFNSRFSRSNAGFHRCDLDFGSSMVLRLDRLSEIPSMPTVSQLFEKIFQYAEEQDLLDPVWGFSDSAGLNEVKYGFWPMLLSLLPETFRTTANASRHLVVQNLATAS